MPPTESTRALPVFLLVLLLLLFAGRAGFALWENRHPPLAYERVEWLDPGAAAEASALHRRPVLYDFTAEWCGPCKRLNAEVFADRLQATMITGMFVPARVLDRRQEDGANPAVVDSLEQRFAIRAFPTLVAVTADGKEVSRVVGYPGARAIMDSLQTFSRRVRLAAMPRPQTGYGIP